jgi:hypothetical protein
VRRYGRATDGTIVAGKNAGLKLALAPLTECVEPVETTVETCAVAIDGLYWFSDESGGFDATVEAAYLLPESQSAGPVLAIAKLTGELCDEAITWSTEWTPDESEGPAPATLEDSAHLIVYPTANTAIGVLEVTAECDGEAHGPILLSIIQYVCYTQLSGVSWWKIEDEVELTTFIDGNNNPIDAGIIVTSISIEVLSESFPFGFYLYIRFPEGSSSEISVDNFTGQSAQIIDSGNNYCKFLITVGEESGTSDLSIKFVDTTNVTTYLIASISRAGLPT